MQALVSIQDTKVVTTSRNIAEAFEKEHKHVLRDIANLDCSPGFTQSNFGLSMYISELANNVKKENPEYLITRDGFTFLAMGYTGKRAAEFKEAYIFEFNQMEQRLRDRLLLENGGYTIEDLIIAQASAMKDVKRTLKALDYEVTESKKQLAVLAESANATKNQDFHNGIPAIPSLLSSSKELSLLTVRGYLSNKKQGVSTTMALMLGMKARLYSNKMNLPFKKNTTGNSYTMDALDFGFSFIANLPEPKISAKDAAIEFLKKNKIAQDLKMIVIGEYAVFPIDKLSEIKKVVWKINRYAAWKCKVEKRHFTVNPSVKVTRIK